jgi:beta-glucanase (GH16 family)
MLWNDAHQVDQGLANVRNLKVLAVALAATALVSLVSFARPSASSASALPPSWKLVFNSNFAGTAVKGTVNPKTWTTCYPWESASAGCTNYGNKSEEKEWYLPSQVKVAKGGILELTSKREATKGLTTAGKPETYGCRSGMVTTYKGFKFKYGFVQVTARLAFGTGLWSAFWLAAANKVWPPEIDILEHWYTAEYSKAYLHPVGGPRQGGTPFATKAANTGWHTYRLYWTKTSLKWYYDNTQVFSTTKNVPQQPMYLIANLADTSSAAGACSGTLYIKSVKIWQP